MNPGVAAAIGGLVGLGLGLLVAGLVVRARRRRRERSVDLPVDAQRPRLPDGADEVLAVLRSAVVVVGPEEEVVDANAAARSYGLVRGSRVTPVELLARVSAVRTGRQTVEFDLTLGSGGGAVFLTARVAPLGQDFVLVLAEDRTAEYRVDETRRDFVANVSHELKTPIGAVSLLAEALEGASDDPDAVRRFAGRLSVESRRLTTLVGQIIDLSRLQGDDPLLQPELVEVDRVLATAVDTSRVEAERRGVTLTLAGRTGLVVVGSERQLTTAVGNLVENAVVYSDTGARVVVAARPETDGEADVVELTVSDNGIGIPAADQERIFERFYRVDYARSRDNGGTGLGLSIVKHVVAAHRGRLSVWSQVGRGSTFTLRLPGAPRTGDADARPDVSADAELDPRGQRGNGAGSPPSPSSRRLTGPRPQEVTR